MLRSLSLIALLVAGFSYAPNLLAADGEMAPAPAPAAEGAANPDVKPFPLSFCVTCGDEFTSEQEQIVTKVHKGREVKLCKGCVKIFNADPDGYLKQVDKSIKTGKPVKEGH
ncbi:MAG: hypothetical protein H0W72_11100 [Planctomycetes bacterium]|nr:hypothetical protein [Planctomycetota bacterium]